MPLSLVGGGFLGPRVCLVYCFVSSRCAIAPRVVTNSMRLICRKLSHGAAPSALSLPVATGATAKVREYMESGSSTDSAPCAARNAPLTRATTVSAPQATPKPHKAAWG